MQKKENRKRIFSDPRDFNSSKGIELEDYDTFFKKQCLPKNMRGVNLKLLELNTRTNSQNLTHNLVAEIPEGQKKMINMKYDLKRMKTRLDFEKSKINEIKKNIGLKEKK